MGASWVPGSPRLDWWVAGAAGAAALVIAAAVVSTGPQADAAGPPGNRPVAVVTDPTTTATPTPTPTPTATSTPTPTSTPAPTDVGQNPLLPNMRSLKASGIRIVKRHGVRRLRFSSTLVDVGTGPLEVVPQPGNRCPKGERDVAQAIYQDTSGDHHYQRAIEHQRVLRQSGCMEFHPAHNHWHIDASARYWLTRPGDPSVLVRHSKVSFCLRDSRRLPDRTRKAVYGACSRDRRQGITPGWGDAYEWFLEGQSLRLPSHLPRGLYCLHQRADPLDVFRESNESDNDSVRAVRISRTRVHIIDTPRCG